MGTPQKNKGGRPRGKRTTHIPKRSQQSTRPRGRPRRPTVAATVTDTDTSVGPSTIPVQVSAAPAATDTADTQVQHSTAAQSAASTTTAQSQPTPPPQVQLVNKDTRAVIIPKKAAKPSVKTAAKPATVSRSKENPLGLHCAKSELVSIDYSLTVSLLGGDIAEGSLTRIGQIADALFTRGFFTLERGKEKGNLHIQGIKSTRDLPYIYPFRWITSVYSY
jgi:hypothetical protein